MRTVQQRAEVDGCPTLKHIFADYFAQLQPRILLLDAGPGTPQTYQACVAGTPAVLVGLSASGLSVPSDPRPKLQNAAYHLAQVRQTLRRQPDHMG